MVIRKIKGEIEKKLTYIIHLKIFHYLRDVRYYKDMDKVSKRLGLNYIAASNIF